MWLTWLLKVVGAGAKAVAVKALGEDQDAAHMARGESTELWAPLVAALNDLADHNRPEADKKRNPERVSTQSMSERAHRRADAGAAVWQAGAAPRGRCAGAYGAPGSRGGQADRAP